MSPDPQALELMHRYVDGTATAEETRTLEAALRHDTAFRRQFLRYVNVDAALGGGRLSAAQGEGAPEANRMAVRDFSTRPPRWQYWVGYAAAACIAACLTLAIQHFTRSTDQAALSPTMVTTAFPESIATLLLAEDCEWQHAMSFTAGQRLSAQTVRLKHGLAVLRFDGGAEVILAGGAELKLQTRGSALLSHGNVVVRASGDAAGFLLQTPASEVVDLGTEFAVKVERTGATEIHVLEGEVAYRKPNSGGGDDRDNAGPLLNAGQAVRYDRADSATPRPTGLSATRFDEWIRGAKLDAQEDLLLAQESFDYAVGRLLLSAAHGGTGWAGPWQTGYLVRLDPGDAGDLDITERFPQQGAQIGGLFGTTALQANPQFISRIRPLAQPVRLDVDQVYYVSLLARQEPLILPSGQNGPPSEVRLVLRSSTHYFGDYALFRLSASGKPQIEARRGQNFTSPVTMNPGRNQVWIGKIVARQSGEDEMFFRIFEEGEAFDLMEPAQWSVQTRSIQSDARLDLMLLTVVGAGTNWFDDIRLGTSWRAVIPPQVSTQIKK
jgi:hypothetical protein